VALGERGTGRGRNTPPTPPPPRRRPARGYSQRIERYAARHGKAPSELTVAERREARGHKTEAEERARRRERSIRQYGASPDALRRLRRRTLDHMTATLGDGRTNKPADRDEIKLTIDTLGAAMLGEMLQWDLPTIRENSALSYDDIVDRYPDAENPAGRNPAWYH
jgi:hypothetical protein